MEHTFHYLLMANQAIVQKKILEKLRDTDLTIGQPKVLEYLGEHNGATQKDIAKACHIEPGSLTSILSRMEGKKLIERKMLNGNRRSLYVFLTPYGEQMQQTIQTSFHEIEDDLWKNISPTEYQQFMQTFEKIYQNLTEEGTKHHG